MIFKDRSDAGRRLAAALSKYRDQEKTIALGLARGGMVVAEALASALNIPVNVIVVRKVGAPGNPELALGAIAEQGEGIFNENLISLFGLSHQSLEAEVKRQREILGERLKLYRGNTSAPILKNKTVILIDDGIATGASMRAAIQSVRQAGAKKIVLAVPVASPDALSKIEREVDEVVCLFSPAYFEAVGSFYETFSQVSDETVMQILLRSRDSHY